MSQADYIKVKKGMARVIIKTDPEDELPTMEMNWEFNKSDATKILVYAMQLKAEKDDD